MITLLDRYGPWIIIAWLLWRDVWPWLSGKVWPARQQEQSAERKRLESLEERQVRAMEQTANAVTVIQQSMTSMDVRLGQIEKGQGCLENSLTEHDRRTSGALTVLTERKRTSKP